MEKQTETDRREECLGKLDRAGWGRATSSVEAFMKVAAFVQGGVGRYRQGWGREARKIQMDRWHTYHAWVKVTGEGAW